MLSMKEHDNKALNFGFLPTALLKAVYFQMHCSVTTY